MVIIHKNWQALPVTVPTVTAPDPIQQPTDTIQQPTADIVELNEINHNEPNEPAANTYQYSTRPPLVQPKKRSRIIEQQGLLDQFSFSSSSLMVGGAVLAGLVFIMSAGKGTVVARPGRLTKWLLLRQPRPTIINIVVFSFPYPLNILVKTKDHPGSESLDHRDSPDMRPAACYINIMPAHPFRSHGQHPK